MTLNDYLFYHFHIYFNYSADVHELLLNYLCIKFYTKSFTSILVVSNTGIIGTFVHHLTHYMNFTQLLESQTVTLQRPGTGTNTFPHCNLSSLPTLFLLHYRNIPPLLFMLATCLVLSANNPYDRSLKS